MKIYTKTGDDGTTGLRGGARISKSHARIQAYGAVDETNSVIGVALSSDIGPDIKSTLTDIQNDLFVVGADLSNPDLDVASERVAQTMVDRIENAIDHYEEELLPLTNFILPGGLLESSLLHMARAVSRRAEVMTVIVSESEKINDSCIKYLNRLSDLLFVLARVVNCRNGVPDVIWKP